MYTLERKSEQKNTNNPKNNTMQLQIKKHNSNTCLSENNLSISNELIQKKEQIQTHNVNSNQSGENITAMHHSGKTAQLQALNSANGGNSLFSSAQSNQSEIGLGNTMQLKKENNTGLPDNLKTGVENLSGISMDDVKVHYNSSKPSTIQAYAYTQGSDIHVAPGKEQYLSHEAWHVVQQKQGRVTPTVQAKGININNDSSLEREADVMGSRAASSYGVQNTNTNLVQKKSVDVVQKWDEDRIFRDKTVQWGNTNSVTTISDPGRRVCFFYDGAGNPIVAKAGGGGAEAPGLYNLVSNVLGAAGINSNRMFKAEEGERPEIVSAIRNFADKASFEKIGSQLGNNPIGETSTPGKGKGQTWKAGETEGDRRTDLTIGGYKTDWSNGEIKGRIGSKMRIEMGEQRSTLGKGIQDRAEMFSTQPIYVSSFGEGKATDVLAKESTGEMKDTLAKEPADKKDKKASSTLLNLLKNSEYMKNLGRLAAGDYFMNYGDRLESINLGNWMNDVEGNITAIDNTDRQIIGFWQRGDEDQSDLINKFKDSNINEAAKHVFTIVLNDIKFIINKNDGTGELEKHIDAYKKNYENSSIKNIKKGLLNGKKDIIKYFKKLDKQPGELKRIASIAESEDGVSEGLYFNRLTARIDMLSKMK